MSSKRGREPWWENGEKLEDGTWLDWSTGVVCWCTKTEKWPCTKCKPGNGRCFTPEPSQVKTGFIKHAEGCPCVKKGSGGKQPGAGRPPKDKLEDEAKRLQGEIRCTQEEDDLEKLKGQLLEKLQRELTMVKQKIKALNEM